MKMKKHTLIGSKEELINAVSSSISVAQALTKLGLRLDPNYYRAFYRTVKAYSIDTSHFKGKAYSKGKKFGYKHPIEDYLNGKRSLSSHRLKIRLIAEGYFEHKCSSCHLSKWLGNDIPIELDHIDGNHLNNNLSNLRILCPNCHAQTPTYTSKNRKNKTPLCSN